NNARSARLDLVLGDEDFSGSLFDRSLSRLSDDSFSFRPLDGRGFRGRLLNGRSGNAREGVSVDDLGALLLVLLTLLALGLGWEILGLRLWLSLNRWGCDLLLNGFLNHRFHGHFRG